MKKFFIKNFLYNIVFLEIIICCSYVVGECYKTEAGQILERLRYFMKNESIEAYIVTMSDAHQSEYVSEADKRIKFLTNFTGSGGEAVITENEALLWTDSRYFQQIDNQLELSCWKPMKTGLPDVPKIQDWLNMNLLKNNSRIGFDSKCMEWNKFQTYSNSLREKGHHLVAIENNLVDKVWEKKPSVKKNEIFSLPLKFSGRNISEKVDQVRAKLIEKDADFIVIPTLDNIAWLLNLRGSDIQYNPVFFSYIVLSRNELYLFIDEERITPSIYEHFDSHGITIELRKYESVFDEISRMVNETNDKIYVESPASHAIVELIPEGRLHISDLVASIKCIKNDIEANGMNEAHIRDAYALVRYMHWLNETIDKENITEFVGAEKLTKFRSELDNYIGLSFSVISSVGSNAAMPHYSPEEDTAKQITRNEIYLLDSGGQYWDGTTDVTRTMHFGTPTDFEMECFTRVLKGFIALATSVFPSTTSLNYFDYVARRPLWQAGLDYGHGTGHGVGAFLYVHEYPPSIHKYSNSLAEVNMFTSNEPGLYLDGQFGIRIEDVIQVVKSDMDNAFSGKGALTFKSITYAPLQTKMIKTSLLNKEEAKFVNDFNRRVIDTIGPMLLKANLTATYKWLLQDTIPIIATG
ncbi:xaa-Pro aminopeptidase ApepP-like [Condylostylus longicornis]|uniref:xaa-Pro aminopeptidase ApepP-like n=1 Tax=Condylostylus longicornis TaxID=2530218 RepID=UPI00244DCDEB|nr:xaa-Pro aminopeptidase ApepP-like [Condylostylus longicornis]